MKTQFYYDLHIHSCLSPCGDDDMTPANIAAMGKLNGLQIMALTDHNTTRNCRPFFAACRSHDIIPIAGMELTTAEDIHIVCLFPSIEAAENFELRLQQYRILYPNKPDIFGQQILYSLNDEPIGTEPYLLSNATSLSIEEAAALAREFDAAVYPAHIDRESNGILAILGAIPESPFFPVLECHDAEKIPAIRELHALDDRRFVSSSDAHVLWEIQEATQSLSLSCDPEDPQDILEQVFRYLKEKGADTP